MRIVELYNDDWCGIYIDGKLIQEGHSVNFHDFMYILQNKGIIKSFDSYESYTEDNYPEELNSIYKTEE